jgi:nucleotide-binding universal stress UspA family protein
MNKILIALDYHPTAEKVAEKGYELAKAMCAEVVLLHVIEDAVLYSSNNYDPIMGFSGFTNLDTQNINFLDTMIKNSHDFLNQTKKHLADDTIQIVVKDGEVATAILQAATEEKANIIVLGSHSQKWLERVLMGSVSEKVLTQITIPLYFIPTQNK